LEHFTDPTAFTFAALNPLPHRMPVQAEKSEKFRASCKDVEAEDETDDCVRSEQMER